MSYSSEVLADSPRAWYRCQQASGLIQDSTANANHATGTFGASSFTYSLTGPITTDATSKAIAFNASAFAVNHAASLDLGDVFTLEAWIKRSAVGASGYGIVSKQNGTFYMKMDTDQLQLLNSNVADIVNSTTNISEVINWHHVVATKNGATCKLYIDGVDRTGVVSNSTCTNTTASMMIGADTPGAEFFSGQMTEIAVYATALSAARVQAHYNAAFPTSTAPSAPGSLVATAGNAQVSLGWTLPTSNGGSAITGYKIYRGLSSGSETLLASPAGTGLTYTDSTTANGTTYYYKVSAVNAIGESALSNEASALPVDPSPTVPLRILRRLYGPTELGTTTSTLYTCPASTQAVIRHIHVSNHTGASVNFTLSIGGSTAATRLWGAIPIPANDVIDHYHDHSLAAGETIEAFASSAVALNLTIDGYELGTTVVPPPAPIFPSDTLFPSDVSP